MKLLPLLIRLKLQFGRWSFPTLWLPIIVLWPILFVLMFVIFFVGVIAVAVLDSRSVNQFFRLFGGIYKTICELRGTQVGVEDQNCRIYIAIS